MHMKQLGFLMMACAVGAAFASEHSSWETLEREQTVASTSAAEAPIDLRTTYPILTLADNPLLENMAYSSVGWDIDEDQNLRTVSVLATPGRIVNGEFVANGNADIPLVESVVGRDFFAWKRPSVDRSVYQLTHRVFDGADEVVSERLHGYLDFADCVIAKASQEAVEAAALATVSHAVVLRQDVVSPWQPMAEGVAGCGIATDSFLDEGQESATVFRFYGSGTFSFDYMLSGGALELVVDGAVQVLSATQVWSPRELAVDGCEAHEVALRFTGDGKGGQAAVRAVRWRELREDVMDASESGEVRVDLREGVRKVVNRSAELLPFAYSPTNWIGDVALASPTACVSVVRMEGPKDEALNNWTEVESSRKTLVRTDREGTVAWPGHRGVWKATFEIRDETGTLEHSETAIFDMRGPNGLVFFLR